MMMPQTVGTTKGCTIQKHQAASKANSPTRMAASTTRETNPRSSAGTVASAAASVWSAPTSVPEPRGDNPESLTWPSCSPVSGYPLAWAWMAVMATVLTMSVTVQPRERSFTGFARPCRTGPIATALAERWTAL